MGDLELLATFWFLNDPESKMWLGFTPFVFIPTGDYDDGKGEFDATKVARRINGEFERDTTVNNVSYKKNCF